MDFPIELAQNNFVDSIDEVMSSIYHLFKNNIGEFLSSYSLGSYCSIHTTDVSELKDAITRTLLEIPNLQVISVKLVSEDLQVWEVYFKYNNVTVRYDLDFSKYYGN